MIYLKYKWPREAAWLERSAISLEEKEASQGRFTLTDTLYLATLTSCGRCKLHLCDAVGLL